MTAHLDLWAQGGAQATAINDNGSISGFYIDGAGKNHGFLISKGEFKILDFPEATLTQAFGLNNRDEVVGQYVDASGLTHGFTFNDGEVTSVDIGVLAIWWWAWVTILTCLINTRTLHTKSWYTIRICIPQRRLECGLVLIQSPGRSVIVRRFGSYGWHLISMRRLGGPSGTWAALLGFSTTSIACIGSGFIHRTLQVPGWTGSSVLGLSLTLPSARW